jgi:hypothetical protein
MWELENRRTTHDGRPAQRAVIIASTRGNGRRAMFRKKADYQAFLKALAHAGIEIPMSVLAYQGDLSTNDMPAITETDAAFVHY